MPAFLNAEIKEMDGPTHTAPHAITIVAPLFDEAAALTLGQALETALTVGGGGQTWPDNAQQVRASEAGLMWLHACPTAFTSPLPAGLRLDGFVTPTIVRFEVFFNFI
jgi:hypothetical protein